MERPASATQPKHTNIGVVGLGIIGRGIAGHLRRKGFSVFVWNRSPRPVPNFVGSLGELAGLCNYIQIFVSDDDALLQTVEQLSEKLTPRHVIFAHSTVAPDSMRAAADIVERRAARFVEACFTGSKGAAEKGELVYYVGGTDEALREGRPILEASSKEILHIGPVGQASAIKVATNMVSAASVQATAEALALVQAEGLPLEKFVEAMRVTSAKRILYASGSGVYGDFGQKEIPEDQGGLLPISTYGASKLAGEALIASYSFMFGLSGCAFRFGNVVGPRLPVNRAQRR